MWTNNENEMEDDHNSELLVLGKSMFPLIRTDLETVKVEKSDNKKFFFRE